MSDLICGIAKDKIRKAYFSQKLPKMLAEIQAQADIEPSELEQLKVFLTELRAKDENIVRSLADIIPDMTEEEDRGIPDELLEDNLTEEEKEELEKEKDNCSKAVRLANRIINDISKSYLLSSPPTRETQMDAAQELIGLLSFIHKDGIYKERLYRKKITEFIAMRKQRKEAEEWAKTTKEYRDYLMIVKLEKRIDDFVLLVKKRFTNLY